VNTGLQQKVKIQEGNNQIIFEMPAKSASTIIW
jgi:O-glycosyl hydrolase